MLLDKTVAVVVPAYNEAKQILLVISSIPSFVDRIIVVNDCSTDSTSEVVKKFIDSTDNSSMAIDDTTKLTISPNLYNRAEIVLQDSAISERQYFTPSNVVNKDSKTSRIILIEHTVNAGVGAAIATGYKWCKDHAIDCTSVMAGDGQMDPSELSKICLPVIAEDIDYVKGNRLIHRSANLVIPKVRYFGNSILSILTKMASGYWHVSDTQTGYTAISNRALNGIKIYNIYKSYGMPNDLLVKLNIIHCTLREIEIKPIYNVGEQSKMKILKVIPRVSMLLIRSFFKRLWSKYLFRDFHPLFLLYNLSFLLFLLAGYYGVKILYLWVTGIREINPLTILAFIFVFTSGFQSFLFAMWMDIQDNERLYR